MVLMLSLYLWIRNVVIPFDVTWLLCHDMAYLELNLALIYVIALSNIGKMTDYIEGYCRCILIVDLFHFQ